MTNPDFRRRLDLLKTRPRTAPASARASRGPIVRGLTEVVGGCELCPGEIPCWHIETPFETACPGHTADAACLALPLVHRLGGETVEIDPRRTLFLDIETGGFAGTPVFLIGIVRPDGGPLRVEQYLARDYPEEEAILQALAAACADRDIWITFNGKSFDEPFLRDRATLHRVPLPASRLHVDLLHAARRRWRGVLPNCRLVTLEAEILNRPRVGDIPSSDVPDLFHHFILTGNAGPLGPVLLHNQIDLIACAELLLRLARATESDPSCENEESECEIG